MISMLRRSLIRSAAVVAASVLVIALLTSAHSQDTSKRGRKYKSPPQTARIEVSILRDGSGKPIENASVIFHPMEGEHDKGNMELKTNEDGKTIIDVLPIGGTVRLQVIAKGFQTYGQDYKVDKAEMAIEVRMKRPGEQYSVYKHQDDKPKDDQKPPQN
jgi:5-hydroxyisourate hydrolase-like protein (transthyretin family)